MRQIARAFVMAAALLIPGQAAAQDHQQLLSDLIAQADQIMSGQNMARMGPEQRGALAEGDTMSFSVAMEAGRVYRIVGVCDTDCSDLDITLYGPSGDELAEDTLADDAPVVDWTARVSAAHRVTVQMFDCDVAPCYFAYAVYRQ